MSASVRPRPSGRRTRSARGASSTLSDTDRRCGDQCVVRPQLCGSECAVYLAERPGDGAGQHSGRQQTHHHGTGGAVCQLQPAARQKERDGDQGREQVAALRLNECQVVVGDLAKHEQRRADEQRFVTEGDLTSQPAARREYRLRRHPLRRGEGGAWRPILLPFSLARGRGLGGGGTRGAFREPADLHADDAEHRQNEVQDVEAVVQHDAHPPEHAPEAAKEDAEEEIERLQVVGCPARLPYDDLIVANQGERIQWAVDRHVADDPPAGHQQRNTRCDRRPPQRPEPAAVVLAAGHEQRAEDQQHVDVDREFGEHQRTDQQRRAARLTNPRSPAATRSSARPASRPPARSPGRRC